MRAIIVGGRGTGLWIAWLIVGGVGRMGIGLLIVWLLGTEERVWERLQYRRGDEYWRVSTERVVCRALNIAEQIHLRLKEKLRALDG
jgi:hypothetical protein